MANVLVHTADEGVTLTAQAAKRLLERGDGDAALLYLALLRHHGSVPPRSLAGELRWDRPRIEAAEETLRALGLIAPAEDIPLEPADEKPVYQRADIAERLEGVTIHDLRMVQGPTHTNLVFDAVVPYGFHRTHAQVKEEIEKIVQETWENYYAVIQVEQSYI